MAASTSPGSISRHFSSAWCAHTPERQSACNSTRTWSLVGLGLVQAALRLLHLRQDAEQILHMVSDLVRDHIGLGELAALASDLAAAETSLEVLEERGVEIDLPIVRTIERSHRGLREPARRARGTGKHDQRRRLIGLAGGGEDFLPLHLGGPETGGNDLSVL